MATVRQHIAHFSIGEISKAGLARVDYEKVEFGAETQENIFSHVVGKGVARPGLGYVANTASNETTRLIPFVRAIDDTAILAFSNGKLRVIVGEEYVTRPAVSSNVINGDFSSSTGWTLSATDGANATISSSQLNLQAVARGSVAYCERVVNTSSTGVEHCLEIDVANGPVVFQCGSTSGGVDYIPATPLDTGYHSLTFTPTGSFYVRFTQRNQQFARINSIQIASGGIMELTAPWSESDLREIQHDQSLDIVFLAHKNWKQRKIERRNNTTSWSVAEYESNDGPFRSAPGAAKLTVGATYANRTVTSDTPIFSSDMVGTLIRFYHDDLNATWELAGDDTWTDVHIVRGIQQTGDRTFNYTIDSQSTATLGLFSATVRSQRSLTGADGNFMDTQHTTGGTITRTSSVAAGYTGLEQESNLTSYMRWGIADGDYTSGVVKVRIDYPGYSGFGVARITDFTSTTSVDVEILEDINSISGTRIWQIGAWSDYYEWPSAVTFYDGRLWWGGQDSFWGSASDAYYTFDDNETGDAATIQRAIATGGQTANVNWFLPLQRLIIGTTGSEVSARSSSFDEPLTPTNVTLKDASSLGSKAISPVKIDSRGVFVHRSGTSVHAVLYSFDNNDYTTDDLTELNEDICSPGIVELTCSREPENYIWCTRADGQVAVLNYDWAGDKQLKGWFRFVTDGEVESVCVVPATGEDGVFMVVKRTIDGATVRYIEKLAMTSEAEGGATHKMADSHTFVAGPVTSVTATHLANETGLIGWGTNADGDGVPLSGLSANGTGLIDLGGTYTNVCVGLPYSCKYKSYKLAYGAAGGTSLLQKKRVDQLGVLLANTHRDAISFGPDFTRMVKMDLVKDGVDQASTTVYDEYDEVPFAFPGEWDTDSRICLQIDAPYPCTLLGLVVGIETNEK